jgi:hypothetical protein
MTKGTIECMDRKEWYAAADFWGVPRASIEAIVYVILPQFWGLRKMQHRGILPHQLMVAFQMYFRELSDRGFLATASGFRPVKNTVLAGKRETKSLSAKQT